VVNLLLLKIGSEPGLEEIPNLIRGLNREISVFGVLTTPNQTNHFDHVISSSYDAMFGAHDELLSEGLYVRPELYKVISAAEGRIIRMYDRLIMSDMAMFAAPRYPVPRFHDSTEYRMQLFLRHAAFWDHMLRLHKIDAVVAQNYGHIGYDAVLFEVVTALEIPYMFFHDFPPFRGSLQMYESVGGIVSNQFSRTVIEYAQENYPFLPDSPDRRKQMMRQIGLLSEVNALIPSKSKDTKVVRLKMLLSKPGIARNVMKSVRRRWNNSQSKKDEKRALSDLPLPEKFLFCELQSQPNGTTALKGWMFPDQRESLALIARHLPNDWKLVVKESDRQWTRMYPRRKNFWSHISCLPKVHLVSSNYDTTILLRKCSGLVETSYSNLALSAIQQGLPVIVLGLTHIGELIGVNTVVSEEQAAEVVPQVCAQNGQRSNCDLISESLTRFLDEKRGATLEGTLGYIPKFSGEIAEREFCTRTSVNVSSVIVAWLSLALPHKFQS